MTDPNLSKSLVELRDVMAAFPSLEAHTTQTPIRPADMYFPKSHAAALDPDRSLVVGNRGMGKSFWANALVNPDLRQQIAYALPQARLGGENIDVHFGFADGEGAKGISRDELKKAVADGFEAEHIWRAVLLPTISQQVEKEDNRPLKDRLCYVRDNPEDIRLLNRSADAKLATKRGKLVFVFDQLEQLADDLEVRSKLITGILRLALGFKSYRGLRIKIFMRPDHLSDDRLFAFSDASKVKGEALVLDWRNVDLYGLLYSRLFTTAPAALDVVCQVAELSSSGKEGFNDELRTNEVAQHALFDVIAGKAMGGGRNRGLPYTYMITHLADARNQVSPRTFLRAIKYAAENTPAPTNQAIDHHGIHEGVRKASENRVDDLKEDYPWVPPALSALRDMLVPCFPDEMLGKWRADTDFFKSLRNTIPGGKQPSWLVAPPDQRLPDKLMEAMFDIGVIENRKTTGKVDVPDIFRLPYNIKRKGGITQQQRRMARIS